MSFARQSVALLGATGSIGVQTLDVLRRERERFELVSIAGGEQLGELAAIVEEFDVKRVAVKTIAHRATLRDVLSRNVEIVVGDEGLSELAAGADIVVNAVLGFAGLPVTLGALRAGKRLALANKESLIAAAPLVAAVRDTPGAQLLPVDSEHCAIHQCLASSPARAHYPDVKRLLLTASGGPFRGWSEEQLKTATKDDALRHPTWSMGAKITIDSSTLMNKGLEVLEATALFDIEADRVDVVVHPQSIVHSMVEYVDGSVLAQLSRPDMRLPIAYCLGLPDRLAHSFGAIDFSAALELTFEPPDRSAFPAISLAYEAARLGGAAPAWLSAANEVAVGALLEDRINWSDVIAVVAATMDHYVADPLESLASLYENDDAARRWAAVSLDR
jgi:1-deoxy-D-xylulose-5-phosphate reductoisomerase